MKTSHSLNDLQLWFQHVITYPTGVEDGIQSAAQETLSPMEAQNLIQPSRKLNSIERLTIYANAYYARLIDCMGAYFPVLKRTLGDEVFNSFVLEYLQQYPSHSYTLDSLGTQFVQFLKDTKPQNENENQNDDWPDFLIELATLEWTIARTFDDDGNEGKGLLTSEILQAFPAEQFAKAKLLPVISLQLMTFRYPISSYYTAVKHSAENENVTIPDAMTEHIAILRRDYIVRRYPLSEPQFLLLQKILSGAVISEAIFNATSAIDLDDRTFAEVLQSWFYTWSNAGFFAGIS